MTKEKLAELLNNREYGNEITKEEAQTAKENGLVVVYGFSDDNMEFDGAFRDEFGCYEGGTALVNKEGLFEDGAVFDMRCPYRKIEAVWCDTTDDYAWSYKTDIPHATFDIMDDGEMYCRGIVFDVKDLEVNGHD